jgi:hypothetical protein
VVYYHWQQKYLYLELNIVKINEIGGRGRRTMIIQILSRITLSLLLMSSSIVIFTSYLLTTNAYSQIQPSTSSSSVHKAVGSDQLQVKVIEASGHFANNQIKNDSVSWIQGGLWYLAIYNSTSPINSDNNTTTAAKAVFSGNFTMVKPDGSESHEHSIKDFKSNNVIISGGDMIITGIGNIYYNAALKYPQVPITVHLMGKQHVLGLIIDAIKTGNHFISNHEMYGTMIKGTGLERIEKTLVSPSQQQKNNDGMKMNG